jgi:sigma-B regulation protein RsbU (phosphoserine phosphatase)
MKILIAEDDQTSRWMLEGILRKWGYDVNAVCNGQEAWQAMQAENPPALAIIDWMMPGMDGVEFCHKVRESLRFASTYIILLTGKRQINDVIIGLDAGANDYIRKPFDREELHARIRVGKRVIELQSALAERVKELEEALSKIETLQALLPPSSN